MKNRIPLLFFLVLFFPALSLLITIFIGAGIVPFFQPAVMDFTGPPDGDDYFIGFFVLPVAIITFFLSIPFAFFAILEWLSARGKKTEKDLAGGKIFLYFIGAYLMASVSAAVFLNIKDIRMALHDTAVCLEYGSESEKSLCYARIGYLKKDLSVCEQANNFSECEGLFAGMKNKH